MSCTGIGMLTDKVQVMVQAKSYDGAGGMELTDNLLAEVWANIDFMGSKEEMSGERNVRYNLFEATMRTSPVLDDKPQANTLKIVVSPSETIYPRSYKIKNNLVTFKCTDRHEI